MTADEVFAVLNKKIKQGGGGGGDVPTALSELINDVGFITDDDVPKKLSELENDESFMKNSGDQKFYGRFINSDGTSSKVLDISSGSSVELGIGNEKGDLARSMQKITMDGEQGDISVKSREGVEFHIVDNLNDRCFKTYLCDKYGAVKTQLHNVSKEDIEMGFENSMRIAMQDEANITSMNEKARFGITMSADCEVMSYDGDVHIQSKPIDGDVYVGSRRNLYLLPNINSDLGKTPQAVDGENYNGYIKAGCIKGVKDSNGNKPTITNFSDIHATKFEEDGVDLDKKYAQINNLVEYIGNIPQKDFGTTTVGSWVATEDDYKQLSRQFMYILSHYRALSLELYVDCNYNDTVILDESSSSGIGSCVLPIRQSVNSSGSTSYGVDGYLVVGDAPHLMNIGCYYTVSDTKESISMNIRAFPNSDYQCNWTYNRKTDTIDYMTKNYDYFQISALGGMIPNGTLKTINID